MGGDKEEVIHKKRLPNGSLFLYLVKRVFKGKWFPLITLIYTDVSRIRVDP